MSGGHFAGWRRAGIVVPSRQQVERTAYRDRQERERAEAKALVEWADLQWWGALLTHVPNERKGKASNGQLKAMGVRKGEPDYWLHLPRAAHPGLCFEFKATPPHDALVTEHQVDRLQLYAAQGYAAGVVRGLDVARLLLTAYVRLGPVGPDSVERLDAKFFDWAPEVPPCFTTR